MELPSLAAFADPSLTACCAVVYVVWPLASGRHKARILIAKSRMTPKKGIAVPQAEMCGVVVICRLVVLASLHLARQIKRISIFTNSECVVSAIQKDGHTILPYWQARVSEVTKHREDLAKDGCDVEEVLNFRAEDSLDDFGTRGLAKLSELGLHSMWQTGPSFLMLPHEQWPLRDLAAVNSHKATTSTAAG